jgi:hypothetical protein
MRSLNKILFTLVSVICLLGTTSCLKDDPIIDWGNIKYVIEMPYKSHYILKQKVTATSDQTFDLMVNYTINDVKLVKENIAVDLGIDETLVAAYNSTLSSSTKKYILLPAVTYTLPKQITIEKGTRLWSGKFTVKTSTLKKGEKYLLPIKIVNVPAGYTISGNFGHLYIRIDMAQ